MANKKDRNYNCCFCGKEIPFMESHNPSPADTDPGNRCCVDCNYSIVIPSRIIISDLIKEGTSGKQNISLSDYSPLINFLKNAHPKRFFYGRADSSEELDELLNELLETPL